MQCFTGVRTCGMWQRFCRVLALTRAAIEAPEMQTTEEPSGDYVLKAE